MHKKLIFTPLMVALAAGGAMFAQDLTTAVLTGRVTNQNGQALAGVRVLVESPALLGNRQATTDANGNFRLQLLPNGEYSVTYTLSGYYTRKLTTRLIAGTTGNGSIRMTSVDVQEVIVEVEGQRAIVDKTDTVVQTAFDSEFLEKVVGRGTTAISFLAPGMNKNIVGGESLRIRGGAGYATKYLMDGTNYTDGMGGYYIRSYTMDDLIESVALIQSPINSRYGNTDGGIVTTVTSRGSNTWTGTIRANLSRNNWNVTNPYTVYGYRDPTTVMTPNTFNTTDVLTKSYEVAVQGPLWKDRVTFAYGSRLSPVSYSNPLIQNTPSTNGAIWLGAPTIQAQSMVGTFYQAPNGDVIRRPEMYHYNASGLDDYTAEYGNARLDRQSYSTFNQYSVFFQVTPNHQLEYKYTQYYSGGKNNLTTGYSADSGDWNTEGQAAYFWNIQYKAIIGSSGVLEVRHGKQFQDWIYGKRPNYPVQSFTIASRVPMPEGFDVVNGTLANAAGNLPNSTNDFARYFANGYVSAFAANNWLLYNFASQAEYNANLNSNYNRVNGQRNQWSNAANHSGGGYGLNESTSANYQHILNTTKGTHLIDVGFSLDSRPTHKAGPAAPRRHITTGRIAWDLTPADIYNVNTGQTGGMAPVSTYAGKFIVFNSTIAHYSDVDPWGVERWNMRDYQYVVGPGQTGYSTIGAGPNQIITRVEERWGGNTGWFYVKTNAFYINDLWTINDNHSLQGGLRVDMFKVVDDLATYHSYTQPTLRFEYKWDISGDQSRLLNVSWAQFHSAMPARHYTAMSLQDGVNQRVRLWTGKDGQGSAKPYLVDLEDILDMSNYGYVYSTTEIYDGLLQIDPDFKTPISTELTVGLRRNFTGGGYWKASCSYRTWVNEFDWQPGDIFEDPTSNRWDIRRVLRNSEGYDKRYFGFELEWDVPIHKRINFGGSYTFSRLMSSAPDAVEGGGVENAGSVVMSLDWWRDQSVPGGRDAWRPVRILDPEHSIKWYLLFDLSAGKLSQSLSFRGTYTSASWQRDGYTYNYGYPVYTDSPYNRFFGGTGGGAGTNVVTAGTTMFGGASVFVPFNSYSTNSNDSWDVNLRYVLSMPLVRKIAWLATITMSNPFNHRGLSSGNFSVGGTGTPIVPIALTGQVVAQNNPYAAYGDPDRNVWRHDGDINGQYMGRMTGRSIGVQTGLRF
jgi:hypothetical protein